jgi:hypothetical protein
VPIPWRISSEALLRIARNTAETHMAGYQYQRNSVLIRGFHVWMIISVRSRFAWRFSRYVWRSTGFRAEVFNFKLAAWPR